MPSERQDEITGLLASCRGGDQRAFDRLVEILYDDLRAIAHGRLVDQPADHTLRTTALVNEAYVRLAAGRKKDWRDRAHFYAVASRVMRHVLVDYARRRWAEKRGRSATVISLETVQVGEDSPPVLELLELNEALAELGRRDRRLERLVECRFFGGMTVPEAAEALRISTRTAERDWARARAYLARKLIPSRDDGGNATPS